MKMFKSDNNSGVDIRVIQAMLKENTGHDNPYGNDRATAKAVKALKELFQAEIDVYFVTTGTAANIIGLAGLLKPYEAVVCTDIGHIYREEGGALERFSGSNILIVPNKNGKLVKENVEELLWVKGDEHRPQPKVISISQTSEAGTIYTVEEIKELADFAHANDMYLHVDGARISNAVVALDTSFKEMITDTGVDLLSFGGTKNGMMVGEAIISFNKNLSREFKFHRKQAMQLLSKMRFISAQFLGYLEDDVWKENASHANKMGQYLREGLEGIKEVKLMEDMKTNMVFAEVDKKILEELQDEFGFYLVDKKTNKIRLVTSFDTEKEDIDKFIEAIKNLY